MIPYPTSLPLTDIGTLITDYRAKALLTDSPNVVKALWELAGYAAYMTVGEPSAIVPVVPTPVPAPAPVNPVQDPTVKPRIHMALQAAPPLSTEQVIEYLELFLAHAEKDLASAVIADLPWQSILKWAYTQLLGAL